MRKLELERAAPKETRERDPQPPSAQRPPSSHNPAFDLQRTVGNQALGLLSSGHVKAKLRMSQPGDADEQEADRTAERISSATATSTLGRKCSCPGAAASCPACEEESDKSKGIHRKAASSGEETIREGFLQELGPGHAIDSSTREEMESKFGHNFQDVRVHRDQKAQNSARSLNARAFTSGRDLVFGSNEYSPHTTEGKKLLAHELTHVVQQGNAKTSDKIHRLVRPEDVSSEMVGRKFTVSGPFTSGSIQLTGGESVEVVAWVNTSNTAKVQLPYPYLQAHIPFDIPKRLLSPSSANVSGIAHYSAGVPQQVAALQHGDQAIAQEQAKPGGARPDEITRLQGLQQHREQSLNRKLIQEKMMNRFDPVIKQWVDYYNAQFGFTGANASAALDPNLVKALFFQESQMGTSGQHLELPPLTHPVKSRFNIGQVIDTSASALLLMIQEMQPGLITTHHLGNIKHDLVTAQSELQRLKSLASPTPAQQARIAVLEPLSRQSWEVFLWSYKAPGQATGFADAVQALFASNAPGFPALNLDYDFWIRTAIRWIFEKRRSVSSWDEAIRAYNGSGAAARHYRDAVTQRAQASQAAQAGGTEFVPPGL